MKKENDYSSMSIVALLVGMFTGCGNDAKESNNDQETQAAAEDQAKLKLQTQATAKRQPMGRTFKQLK